MGNLKNKLTARTSPSIREQRALHSRDPHVACDELLKSDMDQFGMQEEYGLLRKLIKELSAVTLYETVENTHIP